MGHVGDIGRGRHGGAAEGTRITRAPEGPGDKGHAGESEPTRPGREVGTGQGRETTRTGRTGEPRLSGKSAEKDGFGATPTTGNRPALGHGQVRGPVLPVKELVPPGLGKLAGQEAVAQRFASDLALLHQQVRPSELPSTDRALRLWAFFTAYAEAAAAHEPTQEGSEHFDKALQEQGFAEHRDARTGEDGLRLARWVLAASSPEEARQRAEQVLLEPPPEVLLSESAQQPEAQARKSQEPLTPRPAQEGQESAFAEGPERPALERMEGHSEFVRASPQVAHGPRQVMVPVPLELRDTDEPQEAPRPEGSWKKLGGNMLWNVLHRFRGSPEDSALEKEKFNQVAFAAMLAFVGMMLLGILLVSL